MNIALRRLLLIILLVQPATGFSQPAVTAKYSGGHAEFNIYLTLYADSTYLLDHRSGLAFPVTSKRTGTYSITDTSITLTHRKNNGSYFSFPGRQKNTPIPSTVSGATNY